MGDDQQKRGPGPFVGCLATALLIGLPAYVLSVGPFVWLVDHGYVPSAVEVVYIPLGILANSCKPIREFFDWYLALWGV